MLLQSRMDPLHVMFRTMFYFLEAMLEENTTYGTKMMNFCAFIGGSK